MFCPPQEQATAGRRGRLRCLPGVKGLHTGRTLPLTSPPPRTPTPPGGQNMIPGSDTSGPSSLPLGGLSEVEYSAEGQILHWGPGAFASDLRQVWRNVGKISAPGAHLVARFGGIDDRKADPLSLIEMSFDGSGFELRTITPAGSASTGQRQDLHFSRSNAQAREEHDVWAIWPG